jgi:hypothetical protein
MTTIPPRRRKPGEETFIEYKGIRLSIKEWAKRLRIKVHTLEKRLQRMRERPDLWDIERLLSTTNYQIPGQPRPGQLTAPDVE